MVESTKPYTERTPLHRALQHAVNASGLDARTNTGDTALADTLLPLVTQHMAAEVERDAVVRVLSNPELRRMVVQQVYTAHGETRDGDVQVNAVCDAVVELMRYWAP